MSYILKNFVIVNLFLLENTFKVGLQYHFNVVILISKFKIGLKNLYLFKPGRNLQKTERIFSKKFSNQTLFIL